MLISTQNDVSKTCVAVLDIDMIKELTNFIVRKSIQMIIFMIRFLFTLESVIYVKYYIEH